MRLLMEGIEPLTRQEVEDFTKEWYAIQNGEDATYIDGSGNEVNYKEIYNDPAKRRKAFDDLYDRATAASINGWPLTQEAAELMRKIWLEIGFEGFDGTEAPFKALRAIFKSVRGDISADKHLAPLLRMFYGSRSFDRGDYERIQNNQNLQKLLALNNSLYKYPADDLANGLEAIDKIMQENPGSTWKKSVFEDGSKASWDSRVKDLRQLASEKVGNRDATVRVNKMRDKSIKELANYVKAGGMDLSKAEDAQLLVDTGNAALKQINQG